MRYVSGGPVSPGGISWSDGGPLALDQEGWDGSVADQSVQEECPGVVVGHWPMIRHSGIGSVNGGPIGPGGMSWSDGGPLALDQEGWVSGGPVSPGGMSWSGGGPLA